MFHLSKDLVLYTAKHNSFLTELEQLSALQTDRPDDVNDDHDQDDLDNHLVRSQPVRRDNRQ